MKIKHSRNLAVTEIDSALVDALPAVSEADLRELVEELSFPRHYFAEPRNNRRAAELIAERFLSFGYQVSFQGEWANVMALPQRESDEPCLLIGAHYDSVPGTPGADDNASAVAAMLACAKAVAEFAPGMPVCFVAFNREEDGLIGSADFVNNFLPGSGLRVAQAHILEMVGYCSHAPGSQQKPLNLPVKIPDTADFLGLVGNRDSHTLVDSVLQRARNILPEFLVVGLNVYFGLEKRLPVLSRSDHDPFWKARIPAVMWTDTAEFRNPHYHQPTDTPVTLDYAFLRNATRLLIACLLTKP